MDVGITKEGWFLVRLPMLLPKKDKGTTDYIRQILYPVMQSFFTDKELRKLQKSVLIYRHVYDETDVKRRQIDHDNFDMNTVSDIIALYVLRDDCRPRVLIFIVPPLVTKTERRSTQYPKKILLCGLKQKNNAERRGDTI